MDEETLKRVSEVPLAMAMFKAAAASVTKESRTLQAVVRSSRVAGRRASGGEPLEFPLALREYLPLDH